MSKLARDDFLAQKKIAESLAFGKSVIAKIDLSIGNTFLLEGNLEEMERYFKSGLKFLEGERSEHIDYRLRWYYALTERGLLGQFAHLERLLKEIDELAERENDPEKQVEAIKLLLDLYFFYSKVDKIREYEARLKRVEKNILPSESVPSSENESDRELSQGFGTNRKHRKKIATRHRSIIVDSQVQQILFRIPNQTLF
jgi:hypothetical protein